MQSRLNLPDFHTQINNVVAGLVSIVVLVAGHLVTGEVRVEKFMRKLLSKVAL